jgi:hypothetical protein
MGFAAKWLGVVVATAASLPLTEIPAFSKEPEGLLPPEKTVLPSSKATDDAVLDNQAKQADGADLLLQVEGVLEEGDRG